MCSVEGLTSLLLTRKNLVQLSRVLEKKTNCTRALTKSISGATAPQTASTVQCRVARSVQENQLEFSPCHHAHLHQKMQNWGQEYHRGQTTTWSQLLSLCCHQILRSNSKRLKRKHIFLWQFKRLPQVDNTCRIIHLLSVPCSDLYKTEGHYRLMRQPVLAVFFRERWCTFVSMQEFEKGRVQLDSRLETCPGPNLPLGRWQLTGHDLKTLCMCYCDVSELCLTLSKSWLAPELQRNLICLLLSVGNNLYYTAFFLSQICQSCQVLQRVTDLDCQNCSQRALMLDLSWPD